jgi:hypothetical protein
MATVELAKKVKFKIESQVQESVLKGFVDMIQS